MTQPKRGLGRGLDALIPHGERATGETAMNAPIGGRRGGPTSGRRDLQEDRDDDDHRADGDDQDRTGQVRLGWGLGQDAVHAGSKSGSQTSSHCSKTTCTGIPMRTSSIAPLTRFVVRRRPSCSGSSTMATT